MTARRNLKRRRLESRRSTRQHARAMRPCLRQPPMPCDCGPGDPTCGRYRLSPASQPPKARRAMKFGGGGFRTTGERRSEWERNKRGRR
jgi:hypothetical protein